MPKNNCIGNFHNKSLFFFYIGPLSNILEGNTFKVHKAATHYTIASHGFTLFQNTMYTVFTYLITMLHTHFTSLHILSLKQKQVYNSKPIVLVVSKLNFSHAHPVSADSQNLAEKKQI